MKSSSDTTSQLKGRRILLGLVAIAAIIAIGNGALASTTRSGLAVFAIAYFTGLIALFMGFAITIIGFLGTLPFFSTLFGFVAVVASKIHFIVFRIIVGRVISRMPLFKRLELVWKNNRFVRFSVEKYHAALRGLGFNKPVKIKFFAVTRCADCGEDIPVGGAFCPFCGLRIGG